MKTLTDCKTHFPKLGISWGKINVAFLPTRVPTLCTSTMPWA